MTSGLVDASFSLPEWQAVKMIFFCTPFSFRNIGKPQVAFVIAALFVFLSWVKEQDLVVVIIYKRTVSVVTAETRLPRNEKVNKSKKPISFISKKKNISAHASHFLVNFFPRFLVFTK